MSGMRPTFVFPFMMKSIPGCSPDQQQPYPEVQTTLRRPLTSYLRFPTDFGHNLTQVQLDGPGQLTFSQGTGSCCYRVCCPVPCAQFPLTIL